MLTRPQILNKIVQTEVAISDLHYESQRSTINPNRRTQLSEAWVYYNRLLKPNDCPNCKEQQCESKKS